MLQATRCFFLLSYTYSHNDNASEWGSLSLPRTLRHLDWRGREINDRHSDWQMTTPPPVLQGGIRYLIMFLPILSMLIEGHPSPHLGLSDHLSLLLIPTYTPLRRQTNPSPEIFKTWPENVLLQLEGYFACTVEHLRTSGSQDTHRDCPFLHKVLNGKCDSQQTHPGLFKQETLDD